MAFVKSQQDQFDAIMAQASGGSEEDLVRLEKEGKIKRMSLWQALTKLDALLDESDPDLDLPNSIHALQVAEAIRKDLSGLAKARGVDERSLDWLVLVGLLHDIGKVDALLRPIPQWAAVGDTFPVGCRFSEDNIFFNDFKNNPDVANKRYNSIFGIYGPNCGLCNINMAWGHDEYAYRVLSKGGALPDAALFIIRYHSFYPLHQRGAYAHLLNQKDKELIRWVQAFNPYDLYSKSSEPVDKKVLATYYRALINKYFPPQESEDERMIVWPVLSSTLTEDA